MHLTRLEWFELLLSLQAGLIVTHDLVEIRGWAHGSQVRAAVGRRKFWLGTLCTGVFPGVALCFALRFWRGPVPDYALSYWWIYCAVTVSSAIAMWWVPYFFGTKEATRRLYATMYAGTIQVLPARGDNPRPNLLHLFFHALFALNLVLALWLKFSGA